MPGTHILEFFYPFLGNCLSSYVALVGEHLPKEPLDKGYLIALYFLGDLLSPWLLTLCSRHYGIVK